MKRSDPVYRANELARNAASKKVRVDPYNPNDFNDTDNTDNFNDPNNPSYCNNLLI